MKKNQSFFITGTDTNIGKTEITCSLIEFFKKEKKIALGMKPIAAGTEIIENQKINRDVFKFLQVNSLSKPRNIINPYSFDEAIAPHIASSNNNIDIDFNKIKKNYKSLKDQSEYLFIEGAGGYLVPLGLKQDISDLIDLLDVPIILVVGVKLGCINHTLLTVEAIKKNNQNLFGWIANCIDPNMKESSENINYLINNIDAAFLGKIPFFKRVDPINISDHIVWPENL